MSSKLFKKFIKKSVLRKQGPPGPPPRRGLVWKPTTHRWIRPIDAVHQEIKENVAEGNTDLVDDSVKIKSYTPKVAEQMKPELQRIMNQRVGEYVARVRADEGDEAEFDVEDIHNEVLLGDTVEFDGKSVFDEVGINTEDVYDNDDHTEHMEDLMDELVSDASDRVDAGDYDEDYDDDDEDYDDDDEEEDSGDEEELPEETPPPDSSGGKPMHISERTKEEQDYYRKRGAMYSKISGSAFKQTSNPANLAYPDNMKGKKIQLAIVDKYFPGLEHTDDFGFGGPDGGPKWPDYAYETQGGEIRFKAKLVNEIADDVLNEHPELKGRKKVVKDAIKDDLYDILDDDRLHYDTFEMGQKKKGIKQDITPIKESAFNALVAGKISLEGDIDKNVNAYIQGNSNLKRAFDNIKKKYGEEFEVTWPLRQIGSNIKDVVDLPGEHLRNHPDPRRKEDFKDSYSYKHNLQLPSSWKGKDGGLRDFRPPGHSDHKKKERLKGKKKIPGSFSIFTGWEYQ